MKTEPSRKEGRGGAFKQKEQQRLHPRREVYFCAPARKEAPCGQSTVNNRVRELRVGVMETEG